MAEVREASIARAGRGVAPLAGLAAAHPERPRILGVLLGAVGLGVEIKPPFYCD